MYAADDDSYEESYDDVSVQFNSEWDKLLLLMWKNICVLWSNWEQFVLTILTPIFFCSTLMIMRISLDVGIKPVEQYPILELNDYWVNLMSLIDNRSAFIREHLQRNVTSPFVPEKIVGYAPNLLSYSKIMKGASDSLHSFVMNSYDTCDQLKSAIIVENLFAGVCFTKHRYDYENAPTLVTEVFGDVYPNYLNYHLIFPYACRIYRDTFIGISWSTNSLHDYINRTTHRNTGQVDGGYVGYIREGFAALQNAISMSYIKLMAGLRMPNFKIPKVIMNRYPSQEFTIDTFIRRIDFSMSLMLVLGNFYPVLMFTQNIVIEKERTLKSFTKIMGIGNYSHCLGWMCNYLLTAFISSFVISLLLKIKWASGIAILNHSNFFALLFIIMLYNIATICFVLMTSAFFTQTSFALSSTAVVWFASYVPYIMSLIEDRGGTWEFTFFKYILHNTTLGFIFETILEFEVFGDGFNFQNIFDTRALRRNMSLGSLSSILVLQSLLYICISLYIEEVIPDNFGLARRWDFIFTSSKGPFQTPRDFQLDDDQLSERRRRSSSRRNSFICEVGGGDNVVVVRLQSVSKMHNEEFVLKNINLQLVDNEVTILLGHNGSGKSTLIKMMCGLEPLTTGTIKIDGFNIFTERRYACASIGLCIGNTLLHPDLTVEDQIRYFSYIKGISKDSVEAELEYYLKETHLTDYRQNKTRNLSMGVLQNMAICCALVGQSRVVLLDDPTSQMNYASQTLIWKLLEREKFSRSIFITSASPDILEGVGDRVAILSNGELQCDGTPVFIKQMYGKGYRLIVKGPDYNLNVVTQKIREFIPNVTPICTLGNEITFDVQESDIIKFNEITKSLEQNLTTLGIESVTLRPLNMHDIFFKIAAANPCRENRSRLIELMNGQSSYPEENNHLRFMEIKERVTGIKETLQHCEAIWSQRWIYATYFKTFSISRLIYSPIFAAMAFFISSFQLNMQPMPYLEFNLEEYKSSVTVIERRNNISDSESIVDHYKELILWLGVEHTLEDTEGKIMSDYILRGNTDTMQRFDQYHHVGASFSLDYIIAWFNNVALHSVPLSLNLVHNAILRTILGADSGINVGIEPINNQQNYLDSQLRTAISTSHILPLCLSMCVCCIWNSIVHVLVRDIQTGYDKVQLMSGAKFFTYWLVNLTYDTIVITLTSLFITCTIMACQYHLYVDWTIYLCYAAVLMLCGWCVYAFNYILALFFVSPAHAYSISLTIQTFSVLCFCHIIEAFESTYSTAGRNPYAIYFMVLPLFSFCSAISTIYNNGEFQRICHDENIRFVSIHLENCQAIPNCCRKLDLLSLEDGVLMEMMFMMATIGLCWWIILMCRYRYICNNTVIPEDDIYAQLNDHKRRHNDTTKFDIGEEPSFQEQYQIQKMTKAELKLTPVICDRLGKNFGQKIAVDRVSLILHRLHCFAILAFSGSGVTTLLNLIAGFTTYSYGRILIKGRNVIENADRARKMLGYGRQEMMCFQEFTVENVLVNACKLQSYPPEDIDEICLNLAKVLGLFSHYYIHLGQLSLGLINRLKCAIAVMGNPEIILLDMAIAGIDSAGKREVWNVLKRMQNTGATILVSSISLSDCERYCSRVGFMSQGHLSIIGAPSNVKKQFPDYHYLKIRTGAIALRDRRSSLYIVAASINKLTDFINKNFSHAILKEHRGNNYIFHLPVSTNSTAYILSTLRRYTYYLNIEDFEINHNVLSEPFIAFCQKEHYLQEIDERSSIYSLDSDYDYD